MQWGALRAQGQALGLPDPARKRRERDSGFLAPVLLYEAIYGGFVVNVGETAVVACVAQDMKAAGIVQRLMRGYLKGSPPALRGACQRAARRARAEGTASRSGSSRAHRSRSTAIPSPPAVWMSSDGSSSKVPSDAPGEDTRRATAWAWSSNEPVHDQDATKA